ncbi:MAG: hypothetical protein IPK26_03890 [Planctomycetes bacterium]|nr:hypothetical protein [Planctomycetota bacterium]
MTSGRPRTIPRPRPGLLRRPTAAFGWLDQALLHEGWLARAGPHATAVLVLLALAADRHGASFFSRLRMATALGLPVPDVDRALARLRDLQLVDFAPWRPGAADGVWQILPMAKTPQLPRSGKLLGVADILASLGFPGPRHHSSPPHDSAE